jgi:hypothetical protein
MNRYGQLTTWGTLTAPQIFTTICTEYSYRDLFNEQLDDDMAGDQRALILHSGKAEISFSGKVTDGSTNFLDLSGDAASITVTGLDAGVVLCSRAVERWSLGQPKTCSIQATHYQDITQGSPAAAGVTRSAFTPDQSGFAAPFISPGGKLIYGTQGLTSTGGVVHTLEITQELQLSEDDPDPTGKILGVTAHGYLRRISMDLLIRTTDTLPTKGGTLNLTGTSSTPTFISNYVITNVETRLVEKRNKMINVAAIWLPAEGFGS